MYLTPTVLLAAVAVFASPCIAADVPVFMSGSRLLATCQSLPNMEICLGYVEGVADEVAAVKAFHVLSPTRSGKLVEFYHDAACVPPGIEGTQARDVVVRYLEGHPEMRNLDATSSVFLALREAFPCQ